MIFDFQMAAFVDDDVLNVLRREMDEIAIERNILVLRARSSFGSRFPDDQFSDVDS